MNQMLGLSDDDHLHKLSERRIRPAHRLFPDGCRRQVYLRGEKDWYIWQRRSSTRAPTLSQPSRVESWAIAKVVERRQEKGVREDGCGGQ
jgi:hypothetical protein